MLHWQILRGDTCSLCLFTNAFQSIKKLLDELNAVVWKNVYCRTQSSFLNRLDGVDRSLRLRQVALIFTCTSLKRLLLSNTWLLSIYFRPWKKTIFGHQTRIGRGSFVGFFSRDSSTITNHRFLKMITQTFKLEQFGNLIKEWSLNHTLLEQVCWENGE